MAIKSGSVTAFFNCILFIVQKRPVDVFVFNKIATKFVKNAVKYGKYL